MYNSAKLQLEASKSEVEDLVIENLDVKKILHTVQQQGNDLKLEDPSVLNYDRDQAQVNKLVKSLKKEKYFLL